MPGAESASDSNRSQSYHWWLLILILGATLGILFSRSFQEHQVLWSNDGPLGAGNAAENRLPGRFSGTWRPSCWLGEAGPGASLTISNLVATTLSPVLYLKLYAPLALMLTGFCAWLYFRQLRFQGMVCVIGGVAAALNMHFFSVACWGQGTWDVTVGATFLALAALSAPSIPQKWAKAVLAGLAVGMGLMEGFDVGAILSVYVGVFILFRALIGEEPWPKRIAGAFLTEALVIFFAGFLASYTISTLVMTQVEGISSNNQDESTKEKRWIPATRWSLPKLETAQILVPGLFGYRLWQHIDGGDRSSAYWGRIGEDPKLLRLQSNDPQVRSKILTELNAPDEYRTQLNSTDPKVHDAALDHVIVRGGVSRRFTGTGEYAGILVDLLAVFGLMRVFRKTGGVLSRREKLEARFWAGAAIFSLLAAWGRFGFVYRILYQLPYFSTIRNPVKFLHPFQIAWVILAVYGLEIMYRRYMQSGPPRTELLPTHFQHWWAKAPAFEKRWVAGSAVFLAASVVGWFIYSASKTDLANYLAKVGFPAAAAMDVARFSCGEVAWFLLFLSLSVALMAGILCGGFAGDRAKGAWVLIIAIVIFDLGRADQRWVHYIDYEEKYALNSVVEFLSDKPYEHRVIGKLAPFGPGSGLTPGVGQLYYYWLQNDFAYNNIQAVDFAQMPRVPDLDRAYSTAFWIKGNDLANVDLFPAVRIWQLTNTRYLIIPYQSIATLNEHGDLAYHSIRALTRFAITRKPEAQGVGDAGDTTIYPTPDGPYALAEYPRALPRAKLYSNWQTPTNDDAALKILASHDFDPAQTVLLSPSTPVAQNPGDRTVDPGTVTITDYKPKRVRLQAHANAPSVLLLNDRTAPDWHVRVDGTPVPMLRCNYIMRGVFLTPGDHTIEFRFTPSLRALYISACALISGFFVTGYVFFTRTPSRPSRSEPAPKPAPTPKSATPSAPKPTPQSPPSWKPGKGKKKPNNRK